MNWWQAPEYDKAVPMKFSRRELQARRLPRHVEYDDKAKRFVSTPIRIFVAPGKPCRA